MEKKEIALKEENPIVDYKTQADHLIAQAINKNVPVETMEKLLAMRRELRAEFAKEEFDKAMAEFQRECPIINKDSKVDFTSQRTGKKTKYNYSKLDEIVKQTKELISQNGFSYTIGTENSKRKSTDEKGKETEIDIVVSIVRVSHIAGHCETTKFEVPIDKGAYMSDQQQYGSASTFGKRYAFCNAFGIITGDEDNDAVFNSIPQEVQPFIQKATAEQKQTIIALCQKLGGTIQKLIDAGAMPTLDKLTFAGANKVIQNLMDKESKPTKPTEVKPAEVVEPKVGPARLVRIKTMLKDDGVSDDDIPKHLQENYDTKITELDAMTEQQAKDLLAKMINRKAEAKEIEKVEVIKDEKTVDDEKDKCEKCGAKLNKIEQRYLNDRRDADGFLDDNTGKIYGLLCAKCRIELGFK